MLVRSLHILLASLIFISSMGLMMSRHYCKGELKSTAFFGEATPCHADKRMKNCPMHGSMPIDDKNPQKKGCCDTKNELVKHNLEHAELTFGLELTDYPLHVATLTGFFDDTIIGHEGKTKRYLSYKPPLIVYDLSINLQTFLL
ncbi:MAG: hypothetical protein AAGJ93_06805 [Bacteroidota bacterium]